jgi:hypothetical protein
VRTFSQTSLPLVRELAADNIDVAVACRVLNVSRSGYYEWLDRLDSPRRQENALPLRQIRQIHESRGTYGSARVHAELTLGLGLPVNLKRVARLMREDCRASTGADGTAAQSATRTQGSVPTWSTGSSPWTPRTGCGSATSPNIPPRRGRCAARR